MPFLSPSFISALKTRERALQTWLATPYRGVGIETLVYEAWRQVFEKSENSFLHGAGLVVSYSDSEKGMPEADDDSSADVNIDLSSLKELWEVLSDTEEKLESLIHRRYGGSGVRKNILKPENEPAVLDRIVVFPVFLAVWPVRCPATLKPSALFDSNYPPNLAPCRSSKDGTVRFLVELRAPAFGLNRCALTSSALYPIDEHRAELVAILTKGLQTIVQELVTAADTKLGQKAARTGTPEGTPQAGLLEWDSDNAGTLIDSGGRNYVYNYDDEGRCTVKLFDHPRFVAREAAFMRLAGPSAIQPVKMLVVDKDREDELHGFSMQLGRPLIASGMDDSTKLGWLKEIRGLVRDIHAKGIVHGDLKLTNFLMCADGRIRLCGFGNAALITESYCPRLISPTSAAPYRYRTHISNPTPAEDLLAVALLAWEMFTGTDPFPDDDPDDRRKWLDGPVEVLRRGANINEVGNPSARTFIIQCMKEAEIPR